MLSLGEGEQSSNGVSSFENFVSVFSEKPQHLLKQHCGLTCMSVSQVQLLCL